MDVATADATGDIPIDYRDIRLLRSASHAKTQRRRTLNHRVRLAAKQYHQAHPTEVPCRTYGIQCCLNPQKANPTDAELSRQQSSALRSHAEQDLRGDEQERQFSAPAVKSFNYRKPRSKVAWDLQEEEDVALARSRISLPSDRARTLQRHPSLEREDAFCDATTYKGKVHVKRMPDVAMNDDAQIAELYRMGLLYDGDDKRQADVSLSLNNIHHDEPVYTIRPARRGRKAHRAGGYDGSLPLDLSFSDLGHDNDLTQYFNSPDEMDTTSDDQLQHNSRRASSQSSAPLRVIYELATSRPSFDFDTSQPPDLMNDSLSDYDYFSDSELDENADVPSQREVHDAAAATSASGPWVLLGDDS